MSLLKLFVITAFIGLTVEFDWEPCPGVDIGENECITQLMSHGNYCCYMEYKEATSIASTCVSLEFSDTKNYDYHWGDLEQKIKKEDLDNELHKLVCPKETEYVHNNCGSAGINVPQSNESCTRAKIPEQHCCYVKYNVIDFTNDTLIAQSQVCRRFAKFRKSDKEEDLIDDKEISYDLNLYRLANGTYTYKAYSIDCSQLFIKLSLLNIFVIIISMI